MYCAIFVTLKIPEKGQYTTFGTAYGIWVYMSIGFILVKGLYGFRIHMGYRVYMVINEFIWVYMELGFICV